MLYYVYSTLYLYIYLLQGCIFLLYNASRCCRQLQLHTAACSGTAAPQAAVRLPADTAGPHLRGSPVLRGHSAGHGGRPQTAPGLVCVRYLHQGPAGQASLICCCKLSVPLPVACALAASVWFGLFWLPVCGMACFGRLDLILSAQNLLNESQSRCYAHILSTSYLG